MRRFIPFLSLGLFAACVALSFSGLGSALACPGSNSANLTVPATDTTVSATDRSFSYGVTAEWATTATPSFGAFSLASGTTNVSNVDVTPDWWFYPEDCEGELEFTVTGVLNAHPVTVGSVNLRFDVGPTPYNAFDVSNTGIYLGS